ncbi:MAG: sigma-70 family RNA polymerase sigma factor [Pseudonocardia sp.]|nr:sigma-70 family RNA polymerase sigma factor [Pseudonocardia sp.]
MDEQDALAGRFEEHRNHLRAVAYRMLGSLSEADDAVQEAWLRLQRSDAEAIDNLGAWLTTVVGRVALNMLRTRRSRPEEPLDDRMPDPVVSPVDGTDPEHRALMADSVGLALLVVLETLTPDERLAFVLHDLFAVPFDEIAAMLGRTSAAARQLASRARRRVRGGAPEVEPDRARRREVVDAFFAAAHGGDLAALVAVLDPDIVLRADTGAGVQTVHGPAAVAGRAMSFRSPDQVRWPVLVNGAPGVVGTVDGRVFAIMGFTIERGLVVEIDILADPERLARMDLSAVVGQGA